MDKCREEFENWKKQEPQASNGYNAAMAWQHQQKRIDELQAKLDACQKLLEKWKTTGLKGASDYAVGGADTRQECEDELEQALKGGEV